MSEATQHARAQKARRSGQQAEALALAHLQSCGLVLLARNVRFKVGELDLVMRHRDTVVFVEVRWRGRSSYASAAQSVVRAKQARVVRAAQCWLNSRGPVPPCRFDVIAIGPGQLDWIVDAFPGF